LAKVADQDTFLPDWSQSPTGAMDVTLAGTIVGTAAYMSPEQASACRQTNGRVGVRLRALRDADRRESVRGRDDRIGNSSASGFRTRHS
jgi:hypothetical protein